jgi:very-short-patch-repair endonuclease
MKRVQQDGSREVCEVPRRDTVTEFFNRRQEKEKRRALRREMTPAEACLWSCIRNRQAKGLRFQRQYSAGVFILDFYCPSCLLAIELDGSSHDGPEAQEYDAERTKYLASVGIRVLRFTNAEVFHDIDKVIVAICAAA